MKRVSILGYQFDALPSHTTIRAEGEGCNLRVALTRAVGVLMSDHRLRHKHIGELKISVVVMDGSRKESKDGVKT